MNNWGDLTRVLAGAAVDAIKLVNPVAGIVAGWGIDLAFEIVDDVENKASAVAVEQLIGDRIADLYEEIKLAGK